MGKLFLGIGCGPIQTGIFVAGAHQSNFDRIVLAEVNPELVAAIGNAGSITVNTANFDGIRTDCYDRVEIYNPLTADGLSKLIDCAGKADAINTALPGTRFYPQCAAWLRRGFEQAPDKVRYLYTSENSTTAAAELQAAVGAGFCHHYLDTVIGKMSKIFVDGECNLPPLAPGAKAGHLVEEFNTIYSSAAPGLADFAPAGLYQKADLHAFEEAKLYGHNAAHCVLGLALKQVGAQSMSEAIKFPAILAEVEQCLKAECGRALCQKYAGLDDYFTPRYFKCWADELIARMISPNLSDSVDRVIRDMERKLGFDDRLAGALRLVLSQKIEPKILLKYTRLALQNCDAATVVKSWPQDRSQSIRQLLNV